MRPPCARRAAEPSATLRGVARAPVVPRGLFCTGLFCPPLEHEPMHVCVCDCVCVPKTIPGARSAPGSAAGARGRGKNPTCYAWRGPRLDVVGPQLVCVSVGSVST